MIDIADRIVQAKERVADKKFREAQTGDQIRIWMGGVARKGVIAEKHEGGVKLVDGRTSLPFLRVEFSDDLLPHSKNLRCGHFTAGLAFAFWSRD